MTKNLNLNLPRDDIGPFYMRNEAAKYLRVSAKSLETWFTERRGPSSYKVNNRRWYSFEELRDFKTNGGYSATCVDIRDYWLEWTVDPFNYDRVVASLIIAVPQTLIDPMKTPAELISSTLGYAEKFGQAYAAVCGLGGMIRQVRVVPDRATVH